MTLIHEISTMKDLGLTHNQARIYLALIELGPSKAEEISKASEITRQDIYRVMPSLQALGFVETTISRPMIFKALPLQDTLSILVNQREKETAELKEHTRLMLKNHRNKTSKKFDENSHIIYIPGRAALLNRTQRAIAKAKKSLDSVSSWKNVTQHMSGIKNNLEFKKMIKDNIEIRFVTEKPKNPEPKSKSAKGVFFYKPSNLKIRYVTDPPQTHLLIIDQKEVFIRISQEKSFAESPSIWSNNPCIITIAQSYFEKMWNKSLNPDDSKKIQAKEHRATLH